jgi:hypothetical protein
LFSQPNGTEAVKRPQTKKWELISTVVGDRVYFGFKGSDSIDDFLLVYLALIRMGGSTVKVADGPYCSYREIAIRGITLTLELGDDGNHYYADDPSSGDAAALVMKDLEAVLNQEASGVS